MLDVNPQVVVGLVGVVQIWKWQLMKEPSARLLGLCWCLVEARVVAGQPLAVLVRQR